MGNPLLKVFLPCIILFNSMSAIGQDGEKYDTVFVSATKTVVMVFPEIVKHVDVGNPVVLTDVVKVENRPSNKLKMAAGKWFKETSLFVETETGMFTYIVRYKENPLKLLYRVASQASVVVQENTHVPTESGTVSFSNKSTETKVAAKKLGSALKEVQTNCDWIAKQEGTLHSYGTKDNKVFWYLPEMYVKDDYLYFLVRIKNVSNINYDIDFVKTVVRSDKGSLKRNAVQEDEKIPEFIYNSEIKTINGKSAISWVIVLKKFTIDDGKKLFFELWEKGGERKLEFSLFASDILNIKKLQID